MYQARLCSRGLLEFNELKRAAFQLVAAFIADRTRGSSALGSAHAVTSLFHIESELLISTHS